MRSNKAFQIIEEMYLTDLNRLAKFLESPYFNVNLHIIKLYDIYYALYQDKKLQISKKEGWETIFPSTAYNDVKFRKLNSDLLKLILRFLATEAFDDKQMLTSQILLEVANKRKIPKLVNTVIANAQNASRKFIGKNSDLYLNHFHIEKNIFYLKESDIDTQTKQNIEGISDYLDKFYIAEKLKYYCEILSRENLSNITYNFQFIDEILNFVKQKGFFDDLIIRIYYLIYKTLTEPEVRENYYELKKLLFANYRFFDGVELQELFGAIINYSVAQINLSIQEFEKEVINIYDFIFENDIMLNENYLTPAKFKTLITASLRSGNYDFAENFINEYKGLLPTSQRKDIVTFSLGQIYFYRKEYDKVLVQLHNIDYPDIITNLRAKTIYLATLLEMGEYDAIASWIESFKAFLNRKKKEIPVTRIYSYQNFINVVKLISLINSRETKSYLKAENELKKHSGNIVNEQWLKDKLIERQTNLRK